MYNAQKKDWSKTIITLTTVTIRRAIGDFYFFSLEYSYISLEAQVHSA